MTATEEALLDELKAEESELLAEIDRQTERGPFGPKLKVERNKRIGELQTQVDRLDLQLRETEAACSNQFGQPGPSGRWLQQFDDVGNWLMTPNPSHPKPVHESNCHHCNSGMNSNRRRSKNATALLVEADAENNEPDPVPELQRRLKRVRLGIARFSQDK